MATRSLSFTLAVVLAVAVLAISQASAAISPEHRKELAEVKKDLGKIPGLLSKKELDEASKLLDESEQRLKKIAADAKLPDNDKTVTPLLKQIELRRAAIAKKGGGPAAAAISFSKDVAPILTARCLGCHGDNNPRKGLNMASFNGLKQGGQSGPLLVVGSPNTSLIVQRVSATGQGKMPPNGEPLKADEIQKLSAWIAAGAKFDGTDENARINAQPKVDDSPVAIAKATGTEKVSFVNDIAPFMSNLCVNCHSGNNPRAGFSLETFEKLMRGGNSGRVVLPGNLKDSRLWHLVGEQDPIKMPPGQALITERNWASLKTWIEEGAKFDGADPKTPLRALVPTEEQKRAKELAALSTEALTERRRDRANELWKAALSSEPAQDVGTDHVLVIGNAAETRLKQVAAWCDEDVALLKKVFNVSEPQIWRGKLSVFVFKDRFAYAEFVQTNEGAQLPDENVGHARVSAGGTEAYICLQDIGDNITAESPGLQVSLLEQLTAALLQRSEKKAPDWVIRGAGLALAAQQSKKDGSDYFAGLTAEALDLVKTLEKPADIFTDGTFSPKNIGPVGYSLVSHMLSVGGEGNFIRFLGQLQGGAELGAALKNVYGADSNQLALSYVSGLSSAKPTKKTKKK